MPKQVNIRLDYGTEVEVMREAVLSLCRELENYVANSDVFPGDLLEANRKLDCLFTLDRKLMRGVK